MASGHNVGYLRYRWPLLVAVVLLLVMSWQLWQSQSLIGNLRDELAAANAQRAELTASLQARERRIAELEAAQVRPAPLWSAEGLIDQPRLAWLAAAAQGMGFEPGSTPWRPSTLAIPAQFTRPRSTWRSPGSLASGLVHALCLAAPLGRDAWELTIRVHMPEAGQASAIIMFWGLKDDSVAGRDYLLTLREHRGNWYVVEIQERFHCARGVTADGLCL
ncbi:MAG TPA: hypothetical protein DCM14_00190 [Clostridiales bacterium UBA8153]|nr:hypothetical protein [Clostridiales bacterium UBA8153]